MCRIREHAVFINTAGEGKEGAAHPRDSRLHTGLYFSHVQMFLKMFKEVFLCKVYVIKLFWEVMQLK